MIQPVERADRVTGLDARSAPDANADDLSLVVAAKSDGAAREIVERLIVMISSDAQVNIADQRQPQSFAPPARVFHSERQGDAFGENRARRFAVSSGNVQPVVEPRVAIGKHFAADFTEGAGDVAFRLWRVVRPARRDGVADVGRFDRRGAGLRSKSETLVFRN